MVWYGVCASLNLLSLLFRSGGGWMGGWLEELKIKTHKLSFSLGFVNVYVLRFIASCLVILSEDQIKFYLHRRNIDKINGICAFNHSICRYRKDKSGS